MPLSELLEKHDEGDILRTVAEAVLQLIMETDVEGVIGAGRHERAEVRITYRNGYRDRPLGTRLGMLNLRVPTLRQASDFPSFLEPRRTSEKALSRSPLSSDQWRTRLALGGLDRRLDPTRRRTLWSCPVFVPLQGRLSHLPFESDGTFPAQ